MEPQGSDRLACTLALGRWTPCPCALGDHTRRLGGQPEPSALWLRINQRSTARRSPPATRWRTLWSRRPSHRGRSLGGRPHGRPPRPSHPTSHPVASSPATPHSACAWRTRPTNQRCGTSRPSHEPGARASVPPSNQQWNRKKMIYGGECWRMQIEIEVVSTCQHLSDQQC